MQKPTYTLCPYALKPLTDLKEVNDEHIFMDAIGGVKDYCVRVSKELNSDLGTRIDAPLINSPLIAGLRLQHGIKSRAGSPTWKLKGATKDTNRPVEMVFDEAGKVDISLRKPVDMAGNGLTGSLILKPDEKEQFLRDFIANHKRKGKTVIVKAEHNLKIEEIEVPITVDLLAIKRALTKIAYVAVYEYLGDAFLCDPLIPEWHKAFLCPDPEAAKTAKLHGLSFDVQDQLEMLFPLLQPYEHAVAIVNLGQHGPVVTVTLFGKSFHSAVMLASETSNYGLQYGEGRIAICDAKAGKTRFAGFTDHLITLAQNFPNPKVSEVMCYGGNPMEV